MPTTYKVLGQSYPSGGVLTTVYTVPANTSTIVSSIVVANTSVLDAVFRINIRKSGSSAGQTHQYIAYDTPLKTADVIALTLGLTLAAGDTINVYSLGTACTFNVFGSELS